MVERPVTSHLALQLEHSKELSRQINSNINAFKFQATIRNRLALACFDLALEHHNAVIALVETRLAGCAFALLRVMYEAHIRGTWLLHVATEADLNDFQNGRYKLLDPMVRAIGKHPDWRDAGYTKFQAGKKDILDSYVHTGYVAVVRRIGADAIEQVHSEEQEIEALTFADLFALSTAEQIVALYGDAAVALAFQEQSMNLLRTIGKPKSDPSDY